LSFSYSEFIDALKSRISFDLDNKQVEHLWQQTAGWCVSIGLLLESLKNRASPNEGTMLTAGKDLQTFSEYAEEELLKGLAPDFMHFLAKCSLLDVISPESSMIVTGGGGDANLKHLRSLRESAIPHAVLDQPDTYRLHPLIRQVFDRILRNTLSHEELTSTYQAAAEYYRKQGAVLEAIQPLINLPDYETALHIIDRTGMPLWSRTV
jgi:ATP/maltotriose-dependent transcriptional regulator MalT